MVAVAPVEAVAGHEVARHVEPHGVDQRDIGDVGRGGGIGETSVEVHEQRALPFPELVAMVAAAAQHEIQPDMRLDARPDPDYAGVFRETGEIAKLAKLIVDPLLKDLEILCR